MPCYRPIRAWHSRTLNPSGKRSLVFKQSEACDPINSIDLPCGRCVGCRLEHSRQWAIRCLHESQLYEDNVFVTLTYDENHLPGDGSLVPKHFQDFMKRLRKKYSDRKIRYFHCGEYGDKFQRPHYHAIFFNLDFEDKKLHQAKDGFRLYTSEILQRLWGFGFCIIGSVTFESAAYVARYITKKVTGDKSEEHYNGRKPEYCTMSRRPGIGSEWYERYSSDVHSNDFVVINGKRVGVPKFYDSKLSDSELLKIKQSRKYEAYQYKDNNTLNRLKVREICHESRGLLLKRSFEDG
jgi:hypothetical protein